MKTRQNFLLMIFLAIVASGCRPEQVQDRQSHRIEKKLDGVWIIQQITLRGQSFPPQDTVKVLTTNLGRLVCPVCEDSRANPCSMQRIFDDGTVVNFTYQVFSTANPYIPTLHISTFDPPNLSLEWSGPFTVDSLTDEYLAFSCTDRCIAAQNNLGAHTYEVIAKRQP